MTAASFKCWLLLLQALHQIVSPLVSGYGYDQVAVSHGYFARKTRGISGDVEYGSLSGQVLRVLHHVNAVAIRGEHFWVLLDDHRTICQYDRLHAAPICLKAKKNDVYGIHAYTDGLSFIARDLKGNYLLYRADSHFRSFKLLLHAFSDLGMPLWCEGDKLEVGLASGDGSSYQVLFAGDVRALVLHPPLSAGFASCATMHGHLAAIIGRRFVLDGRDVAPVDAAGELFPIKNRWLLAAIRYQLFSSTANQVQNYEAVPCATVTSDGSMLYLIAKPRVFSDWIGKPPSTPVGDQSRCPALSN